MSTQKCESGISIDVIHILLQLLHCMESSSAAPKLHSRFFLQLFSRAWWSLEVDLTSLKTQVYFFCAIRSLFPLHSHIFIVVHMWYNAEFHTRLFVG